MAGALLGCAATPTPDPWEGIEIDRTPAVTPERLNDFPLPTEFTEDSVTFDLAGAQELEAYRVAAEANTVIATEHAGQIDDLKEAAEHLVAAGQAQRKVADLRKEILEEERKHWFWEKTAYWAGFLIIGLAVAL